MTGDTTSSKPLLPVTEEMLEDAPAIQALIAERLGKILDGYVIIKRERPDDAYRRGAS